MLQTTRTFDLEVQIPGGNAEQLYAHLRANQHWTHHPLIVEWHTTAPDEYYILDRVPMMGMMLKVPYRAKVTALDAQTIRFEGFQSMVYVDNRTSVIPTADGCILRENVTVRTSRLLMWFVLPQTKQSHTAMLEHLKTEFTTLRS